MGDEWERERTEPVAVGPPRNRSTRLREGRRHRRRRGATLVALAVFIVLLVGAVFLGSKIWHSVFASDFSGSGKQDLVIEVKANDSTTAIGQTLHDQQVVASVRAFVDAAEDNSTVSAIQPGFYKVRTEIPAAEAVARLADPQSRVGLLEVKPGRQLDDVQDVKTNNVADGIFTLISRASCVQLDGQQQCVSADGLRQVAGDAGLSALKVPDWAMEPASALGGDYRRLEGLIAAGTWNFDPSGSPLDILATLIEASGTQYIENGLADAAAALEMTPYQTLIVASLVEREALPPDFAKVARVIYNRLEKREPLQFDSTVNYPLDRQEVATTPADRLEKTPWNTYASEGLPATPICSPSNEALAAAEDPEQGDWLYFVTVDLEGTTRFTSDYAQHLAHIEEAKRNGVLDSGR